VARCVLDEIPGHIERLKDQVANADALGAGAEAHKIKGATANAGGKALSALAFTLEKAGKAGDLGALARRVRELEPMFAQFKAEVEDKLF
jgi:HPt (histidine-containing phosphotransfer) domain-containing protein